MEQIDRRCHAPAATLPGGGWRDSLAFIAASRWRDASR